MLDRPSVPRRSLDFEDYIAIVRRNWRWLLGPVFAGIVVSTVVAYLMHDRYVSYALIRIVPQQISPEMVQNITAEDVADRINGMAQVIESRNTLSSMITSFGLYPKELKKAPLDDVIFKMKAQDLHIRPVEGVTNISGKSLPAMQVSFAYQDPITAQKVCADVVSRFMNASTVTSTDMTQQGATFFTDQFETAKRDLDAVEKKLADFRAQNAGHLPDEVQTNMAQMMALQQRSGSISDALARNSEQKMMLESELAMAKDRLNSNSPRTQAQSQKVNALDREIDQLETSIASMKNRYTEDFPDLQAARDRLALAKRQREDALKEKPAEDEDSDQNEVLSRERQDAQVAVNRLQTDLKTNSMEGQRMLKQQMQVNSALGTYQARLEAAPAGEKEYSDLLRDRELARIHYADLENKVNKANAAVELNRRKQGETLELLDAASLPTNPSAPKRYVIVPIGLVAGLVLGIIIVGMREVRDTSLKTLKDARLYTHLSVLGSIPLLENDVVVQRRKQVLWVSWAAATFVGLAVMAGSIVHYYMSKV